MSSLQDQLDEITAKTRTLVQPERLEASERSVAELYHSGIEDRALKVGDPAPEFALEDASGRVVRSQDLLAIGPLVIDFFRGRWCPYCVTELEQWRNLYAAVRESGGMLVAISPQTARQNDFLATQYALGFPVLSDPGCVTACKFGVCYSVAAEQQAYYRRILVNIPFMNGGGEDSWRLPLPATYVVRQDGTIAYGRAHADFRVRPEPDEVLEALKASAR